MSPTGVELVSESTHGSNELGQTAKVRAAKSDALEPGLQEVVHAWDNLPAAIREAIGVMVRAAAARKDEARSSKLCAELQVHSPCS